MSKFALYICYMKIEISTVYPFLNSCGAYYSVDLAHLFVALIMSIKITKEGGKQHITREVKEKK